MYIYGIYWTFIMYFELPTYKYSYFSVEVFNGFEMDARGAEEFLTVFYCFMLDHIIWNLLIK